jgi:hypothetical protein
MRPCPVIDALSLVANQFGRYCQPFEVFGSKGRFTVGGREVAISHPPGVLLEGFTAQIDLVAGDGLFHPRPAWQNAAPRPGNFTAIIRIPVQSKRTDAQMA